MMLETFSHPKARDLSVPADDVLLHVPGRMTGVFDGASDSLGRRIDGIPVGRLAAIAAARAAAALPTEAEDWPVDVILETLSRAIATDVPMGEGEGPASTTAMIALETSHGIRMLGIGDTGFRINGKDAQISELAPDLISIPARVALFEMFQRRGIALEDCEASARNCIGKGLQWAVQSNTLSQAEADGILHASIANIAWPGGIKEVSHLISQGLQSQYRFANAADAYLGYGVLNGTAPLTRDAIDETVPYAGLRSIEIFSDGYLVLPPEVSIASWENGHADLELTDPFKIAAMPAVKGSTATSFFDDRTVAIMRFQPNME